MYIDRNARCWQHSGPTSVQLYRKVSMINQDLIGIRPKLLVSRALAELGFYHALYFQLDIENLIIHPIEYFSL